MSKAILVLDEMPVNCLECPFRVKGELIQLPGFCYKQLFRCSVGHDILGYDDLDVSLMLKQRMKWCLLRELPEPYSDPHEFNDSDDVGFADGWNQCINTILNESED